MLETVEDREDVSRDVFEEDSFDDMEAERALEEASRAFSFPFVSPKMPTIKSKTKKPPKIPPAILTVPAFVGCFDGLFTTCCVAGALAGFFL